MPSDACDGASDGLLEMFRHPPVVLFLEIANGNDTVTGADGELGFGRGPAHKGRSSADSQENQSRLISGWRGFPDDGVTV